MLLFFCNVKSVVVYAKMTDKIAAGITQVDDYCTELLNPFVHHLELESTSEKIKTALLTILLLPIRVAVICVLLMTGWALACIGLWGITEEELQSKPITGWRSCIRVVASHLILWIFYVGGFRLKIIGNRANRNEASIVALAPHSSFIDSIAMVYMTGPSIVAKGETAAIPFFGKLINFTQPVYVWRDDPNSRQNTIKEIISRAKSDQDWPQILIFPEGTCTNRSCLITFKPGAFYPGVPVQPVCIRYPNKLDTVTWTWEGPSALKLLWLTLSQVYSSCEIEFLPVYNPSEEEKRDPKLFAHNVRAVMAKALGVPVSDYTYDDCKLITRAKEMNLPNANALLEVQKIRHKLKLDDTRTEEYLLDSKLLCQDCSRITFIEFANYLNLPCNDMFLQQLFRLYDKHSTGVIDFREYLLGVFGLPFNRSIMETVRIAFKIYDRTGQCKLPAESLAKVLNYTLAMPYSEALDIYRQITKAGSDYVTFEQLSTFLERKAEYAGLFAISKEEKLKSRNGEICPNDFKKNN